MKINIKVITIIIFIMLIGLLISRLQANLTTPIPSSTPTPPQAPKTFQFDSTTDLKVELEKVNPEVLDSDFE